MGTCKTLQGGCWWANVKHATWWILMGTCQTDTAGLKLISTFQTLQGWCWWAPVRHHRVDVDGHMSDTTGRTLMGTWTGNCKVEIDGHMNMSNRCKVGESRFTPYYIKQARQKVWKAFDSRPDNRFERPLISPQTYWTELPWKIFVWGCSVRELLWTLKL